MEVVTERCSSLPLVTTCTASALYPEIRIEGPNVPARLGSAGHKAIAAYIRNVECRISDLAIEFDVDSEELGDLVSRGVRAWNAAEKYFPEADTEVYLEYEQDGFRLTGTMDVLSVLNGGVRVLDHKSGYLDADHSQQLKGYGLLALKHNPLATRAYVAILHWRAGDIDGQWYDREELEGWFSALVEKLKRAPDYNPGSHCGYCRRGHQCEARAAMVRQVSLSFPDLLALPGESAEFAATLHENRKILEAACEDAAALEKMLVAQAGGMIPIGGGQALVLSKQERKTIDFGKSEDILREVLGATFPAACNVGKTKAEDLIRATAGKGLKKGAVKNVMDRLEKAGAISVKTFEKLEVKRITQEIGVMQ